MSYATLGSERAAAVKMRIDAVEDRIKGFLLDCERLQESVFAGKAQEIIEEVQILEKEIMNLNLTHDELIYINKEELTHLYVMFKGVVHAHEKPEVERLRRPVAVSVEGEDAETKRRKSIPHPEGVPAKVSIPHYNS